MAGVDRRIPGGAHYVPPPGSEDVEWAMVAARVLAVGAAWLSQQPKGAFLEWFEDGHLYAGTGVHDGLLGLVYMATWTGHPVTASTAPGLPVIALTNGLVYKLIKGTNDRTMRILPHDEQYPECEEPGMRSACTGILAGMLWALKDTFHPGKGRL